MGSNQKCLLFFSVLILYRKLNSLKIDSSGLFMQSKLIIENWRIDYNCHRPHSSLNYLIAQQFK